MADPYAALDAAPAAPPPAPPPPQAAAAAPPPQGTPDELKRAAARDRQARYRAAKKAKRTPSEVLSFAADASLDNLVPTPAASVHHAKAAKVLGIVDDQFMENRHVSPNGQFYQWYREEKLKNLFGENVFDEGHSYEESAMDSNRLSYEMPKEDPWVASLIERVRGRLEELKIIDPGRHACDSVTLLLSKPGAPRQSWHCDFPWKNRIFHPKKRLMRSGCVPYPVSVLIALHKKGASLRVRDFDDIHTEKYGAIVFRGDLTHAGAEWPSNSKATFNWRIHLYFYTKGRSFLCKVPREGRMARGGRHITVIEPPASPSARVEWFTGEANDDDEDDDDDDDDDVA